MCIGRSNMKLLWDNPADERAAMRHLVEAVLMYRNAGMQQWQLLKLAARVWEGPGEYFQLTTGENDEIKTKYEEVV